MYKQKQHNTIFVEKQIRVPNFTMTYEHRHTYCEFFYLKTGSCIYYINENMVNLSPGDFFVVPPDIPHYTRYEGLIPCERILVNCRLETLPKDFLETHSSLLENLSRPVKLILPQNQRVRIETILSNMITENNIPNDYSTELLAVYMIELLILLHRNSIFMYDQIKTHSEFGSDIDDVLRYVAQNYALPLTLEDMAATVNLSPTYLSRKFRKVTGTTFKEYVNYIRIKRASQSLLTTDDSITKIAMDCGFNSSNYFKDLFRKINGISPRDFRKRGIDQSFEYDVPENSPLPKFSSPIDQS